MDDNIGENYGGLHLIAKEEPDNYDVWTWDEQGNGLLIQKFFNYTSGLVQSRMKFKYGLFEISCKIPDGKGF